MSLGTQTCAKLCKRMQKEEIIDAILTELRKNPKITNLQLAFILKLHRNTVSKYRKFTRENYYKTPQEIVNKIDSRLDDELEAMSHFALLAYRSQLVPKKMEVKEEITEAVKVEIDLSVYSDDEKSILDKAARILDSKSKREFTSIHGENEL